jgi:hypothetical protein
MSDIRTIEFDALPGSVRDKFVAITNGTAGPAPLFAEKTSTKSGIVGLSIVFVLLVAASVVGAMTGMGNLYKDQAIHGPLIVLFVYIPVVFLLSLVLLTIIQRRLVGSPFPFHPGRYLFATEFVDARNGTFRIIPTRILSDLKGTHMHTNGVYTHTQLDFTFQGAKEQFSIRGQDAAQAAINAFWDSQRALAAAAEAQDWQTVENLDPFFECRRLGVWEAGATPGADAGPRVKEIPPLFRWRIAIAAGATIALAPWIAMGRNYVSDEMLFSDAKTFDTESSYGQYLDNGWRHMDEARLAQPIAAFREAKKEATVSKMRRILKTYPGSSVESDARAALHGLYVKTLTDFQSKASTADPRMLPFMKRLLDYLEKNDTATVRVVFSPPSTGSLAKADANFERAYSATGRTVEPISPYFTPTNSAPREREIVSRLHTAFASIFPTDVLKFEGDKAATPAREPSISIAYAVGPSGRAYSSDDRQRMFVGIDITFAMRMSIPNDSNLFDLGLKVSPPERFNYRYKQGDNQAEAAYNAMAERAFDEFTSKLQAVFFSNPPPAPGAR